MFLDSFKVFRQSLSPREPEMRSIVGSYFQQWFASKPPRPALMQRIALYDLHEKRY